MNIDIAIEHNVCDQKKISNLINNTLNETFKLLGIQRDDLEICFLLTNDEEIQSLNKTYRGIDKPTNILSFPSGFSYEDLVNGSVCRVYNDEKNNDLEDFDDKDELEFLDDLDLDIDENYPNIVGSIAISYDTVKKEACDQNKTIKDHMCHLVVHGILHLLGFDHETELDAKSMESTEIKVLNSLGIKNPYE